MDAVLDPKFYSHAAGLLPAQGPRSWRKVFNFGSAASFDVDLLVETANGIINNIQAMYVDNADNAYAVTITLRDTLQRIVIPPNSQGVFPFYASKDPYFTVASTSSETLVPIRLLNVPLPYMVWGTQSVGGSSGGGINRVTLADASGTGTGASVQVLAANALRKYIFVGNPSGNNGSVYVNYGAAATNAGDSLEILPGGSHYMNADAISTQSVNILATNLEKYTVKHA